MMVAMPRPRPPHLHREVTRHGKVVWYARAGGSSRGPRDQIARRVRHARNSEAEYQAALASTPRTPSGAA